ncbi:MAG: hypothetical protein IJT94_08775, partial [Oscillibacter sp.]|nr:hypothetical protein [Oscillibacter sp.]
QAVQDTSPCESMIRLVWNVAHIQNSEDFQRGISALCEVEKVFSRSSKIAALMALGSMLQSMSYLRSAFENQELAVLEQRRAMYVSSIVHANCANLPGLGDNALWRDFAESKSSRGPPLRKHQAISLHRDTHRASSVERRVSCAPCFCRYIRIFNAGS